MKPLLIATALIAAFAINGCIIVDHDKTGRYSSDWEDTQYENRRYIAKLTPNMSMEEVKRIMGTPDFNEFYAKDGQQIQVLFYRTHRKEGDGMTSKDECTPLVFSSGNLIGWGETAYRFM